MMKSTNEDIFCVTGPLRGECTGDRWIPLTKANGAELWCFLWSAPEQTIEQTLETPVIWDAIALIMTSLQCHFSALGTITMDAWPVFKDMPLHLMAKVVLVNVMTYKVGDVFIPHVFMYTSEKKTYYVGTAPAFGTGNSKTYCVD